MTDNSTDEPQNFFKIGDKEFWKRYFNGRPQVPSSFWKRLYSYHTSHIQTPPVEPFRTINDIGAGAGVFSRIFAQRFSRVFVTEPSSETLESAKHFLNNTPKFDKFTFLDKRAEDRTAQPPNSIDMAFTGTSMHLTNPPEVMVAIAEQLKPSGTFVFSHTGICSFFDPTTQKIWNRLYGYVQHTQLEQYVANGASRDALMEATRRIETGYDSIAVPQELFRDVRRVKLNRLYPDAFVWGQGLVVKGKLPREDNTDPANEELVEETDETWFFDADIDWMKLHLTTFPCEYDQTVLDGF